MLTGDLVRVRIKAKELRPSFVRADDEDLLERAGQLIELYREAAREGWTRGRVDEAATELEGLETDIKLMRGLAKVLADRSEFATQSPLPPAELRARVFAAAAAGPPLAREAGPTGRRTAQTVLAEVAAALGIAPDALSRALYADLKDEQTLLGVELLEPRGLLERYNLALVQSVLLKATGLTVALEAPDPKRVRQLHRALKFHGLMYRVARAGEDWRLEIDGPLSLLQQSTRYGLQLALFLPTLVLCPTPWRAEAEIRWGQRGLRKQLTLSSADGLVSPARDVGAWKSRVEEYFEARFRELDSGWTILPGEPLDLGGQELLVPDFSFEKGGRKAHLDIVGWWRKGYLKRRLENLPPNVVLAVSRKLAADKAELPAGVIAFAEILPPKAVLERLEAVARQG